MSRKGGYFVNLFKKNKATAAPTANDNQISSKVNRTSISPADTTQQISVQRRSSTKENSVPQSKMRSSLNQSLENQVYFHSKLPLCEIDFLLKANGDFIVRKSMNGNEAQVVLSVFWDSVRHFIVRTDNEGKFKLEGKSFFTVPHLILHYFESKENVSKLSATKLIKPITKENWVLDNNDIELGEKLGEGGLGEVCRGFYTNPFSGSKIEVAIKTFKDTRPDSENKLFVREVGIMCRYKHENIVQLIGVCATKEPMMIVMEFVPGGSLYDYLRKHEKDTVTAAVLKEKVKFCKEAASGMEYLSSQECLHRRLAVRNCLLGAKNTVTITDFGMWREGSISALRQIPIRWTAIEVLMTKKFTTKADVWSFGILMWEVFENGKIPYSDLDHRRTIDYLHKGKRLDPPATMPELLRKVMLSCWLVEPEDRPDFTAIRRKCFEVNNNLLKS